jgi:AraC-like DNA-binding protein
VQVMERGESPVLGQASGVYREKPVSPMLRRHFVSAWFHQKPSGVARQTAVVPDACADLIWFGGNLLVAGPDHQVRFESVPPGATVVGMRFQPGAVAVWLGVPASAIVGARIQLDCFCKGQAQELIDLIGDTRDPAVAARRLEAALEKITGDLASPANSSRIILESLTQTREARGSITRQLTSALGTSERTLRRHCEQAFGYGPKTLDRVLRMQRFLELAKTHRALDLANLAAAAGYADQAHLSREARRLAGLTPATILVQLCGSGSMRGSLNP